jgi:hypothetical protein
MSWEALQTFGIEAPRTWEEERRRGARDDPSGKVKNLMGHLSCPTASKLETDELRRRCRESGQRQRIPRGTECLPCSPTDAVGGRIVRVLLEAEAEGVIIKQAGHTKINQSTGRPTTMAASFPQAPVSDVKLSFSGGPQAALDTPTQCGSYTTDADFTPWSTPYIPDEFPSSSFQLTSGPGGSACSSLLGFSPSLTAGSTTDQAGGYTDFSL